MHAESGILCWCYKPCFHRVSNGMGQHSCCKLKKKLAKWHVIIVPFFWSRNIQTIHHLVPVGWSEYWPEVSTRIPHYRSCARSGPAPRPLRIPREHIWTLFTACSEFQNITLFLPADLAGSDAKRAPLHHCPRAEHKAVSCSRSTSLDVWGMLTGDGIGAPPSKQLSPFAAFKVLSVGFFSPFPLLSLPDHL